MEKGRGVAVGGVPVPAAMRSPRDRLASVSSPYALNLKEKIANVIG